MNSNLRNHYRHDCQNLLLHFYRFKKFRPLFVLNDEDARINCRLSCVQKEIQTAKQLIQWHR